MFVKENAGNVKKMLKENKENAKFEDVNRHLLYQWHHETADGDEQMYKRRASEMFARTNDTSSPSNTTM